MASHLLRMRKALGSNPSVSIADSTYLAQQKTSTGSWLFLCPSCWRARSARVAELALQRLCKRKVMGSMPRVVVHMSWSCSRYMLEVKRFPGAHGVVASHPLRMRKVLGSNPSVSMAYSIKLAQRHPACPWVCSSSTCASLSPVVCSGCVHGLRPLPRGTHGVQLRSLLL